MTEDDTRTTERGIETDGGVAGTDESVAYLDAEVNIFRPSTAFMRDQLKIIWTMFAAWALIVFGPVTATALAPGAMTSVTVLGFPLHYFLTAVCAPLGALVLSFVYARRRDALDRKYGIEHGDAQAAGEPDAAVADGGVEE